MRFDRELPDGISSVKKQDGYLSQLSNMDEFILIILDACRYDALKHLTIDRQLSLDVEMVNSEVHNTHTWVRTKWSGSYPYTYISPIPYISESELGGPTGGSPYNAGVHFKNVVQAWRDNGSGHDGTPESVVKESLSNRDDKMIIHFSQPHMPHLGDPPLDPDNHDGNNLSQIGPSLGQERVSKSYYANLEFVWDKGVEVILDEFDHNNIMVTADHGEAIGEGGRYGHNTYTPEVMAVPWVDITGLS